MSSTTRRDAAPESSPQAAPPRPSRQPTMHTVRLCLRPFSEADAPDVERLAGDRLIADTTQNIPHPYPPGAGVEWIAKHEGIWAAGEGAAFAMVDRTTGALVGGIGLMIERAHASAELGYWVGVPYWNAGYATEAARVVLAHGFDGGLHRIHARHLTRNPASGRVMTKIGMTFEGILREAALKWGRFEDVAVYGMLKRELDAGGGSAES